MIIATFTHNFKDTPIPYGCIWVITIEGLRHLVRSTQQHMEVTSVNWTGGRCLCSVGLCLWTVEGVLSCRQTLYEDLNAWGKTCFDRLASVTELWRCELPRYELGPLSRTLTPLSDQSIIQGWLLPGVVVNFNCVITKIQPYRFGTHTPYFWHFPMQRHIHCQRVIRLYPR